MDAKFHHNTHSVQEIGPFLLFQNWELGKASTDDKYHFPVSWARSCQYQYVYAKVYQNIPNGQKELWTFFTFCPDIKSSQTHPAGDVTRVSVMPRKVTVKIGDAEKSVSVMSR